MLYSAIVVKLFLGKIPGNKSAANQELRDRRSRKVLLMSVVTVLFFAASVTPKWICIFFPALSCGSICFAVHFLYAEFLYLCHLHRELSQSYKEVARSDSVQESYACGSVTGNRIGNKGGGECSLN